MITGLNSLRGGLITGLNSLVESGDFVLKTKVTQEADASTMTISGLAGNTDQYYTIVGRLLLPSATANILTMRPNGLTTNLFSEQSNQYDQTPTRNTSWEFADYTGVFTHSPNLVLDVSFSIWAGTTLNGETTVRSMRSDVNLLGTATNLETFSIQTSNIWNETSTELTSLVINATSSNSILGGSQLLVYTPSDTFSA